VRARAREVTGRSVRERRAARETLAAAIAGQLDPKLRKRADGLVRKLPWEPA
jgi:hypothetical protein